MDDPKSFDGFAADYDRFASLTPPRHLDWVVRLLPEHGRRALDAGCGSGRFTVVLAERFDDVIGIDISEPLIEIARRKRMRPNAEYQVRDLRTFDDVAGFDLIFSSTTMHHIPDISTALARLRTMLRPHGTVLLIDNVAPRPRVPRWRHATGAIRRFPFDAFRLGLRDASWLLRFQMGRAWLDHLDSDRYITRDGFERAYGAAFPGGRFVRLGYLHALVWNNGAGALPGR